jgi:hypothetical protein
MRLRPATHSANLLNDDGHEVRMLSAQSGTPQSEELRKRCTGLILTVGDDKGGTVLHKTTVNSFLEFERGNVSKAGSGRQNSSVRHELVAIRMG